MAKIVKCSDDVIAKIPNIMEHIYQVFGEKAIIVYAVLDDGKIGFIAKDFYNCLYIKGEQDNVLVTPFQLNENEEVGMIKLGDNHFFFNGDERYMVSKDGIEHAIGIKPLKYEDDDQYNGYVCYIQYNRDNDTLCDIRYQHMYREVDGRVPIYGFHTEKIDVLSIDEKYNKRGNAHTGILSRHSKYYSRYEFDREEVGYTLTALKDYGLVELLKNGSYALQKENNVIRYVKAFYVRKDGSFIDAWPLSSQIKTEDLKDLISSYGFRTDVPSELLDIYNGYNTMVDEIQDLASQMKELGKCDDDEMCMILEYKVES